MGWPWSSTRTPPGSPPPPTAASDPPQPTPATASSPNEDRLNADERELRKFLALLDEDDTSKSTSPSVPSQPAKPSLLSTWSSSWSSSSEAQDAPADPNSYEIRERSLAEAVLPVSMSCQQAFDLAWGCQSPVGQWRAIYRHGNVRPCSDLWQDFWFCMRVKSFSPGPAKEETIRSHYREHELARYYAPGQPSSEDVWRSRTVDEVLPSTAVFNQNFQAVLNGEANTEATQPGEDTKSAPAPKPLSSEQADAEKIRADLERRRLIRQQMGYEK